MALWQKARAWQTTFPSLCCALITPKRKTWSEAFKQETLRWREFLEKACAGEAKLKSEVEQLLAGDAAALVTNGVIGELAPDLLQELDNYNGKRMVGFLRQHAAAIVNSSI